MSRGNFPSHPYIEVWYVLIKLLFGVIQSIADDILAKFVPGHVNIFYCFGGIQVDQVLL